MRLRPFATPALLPLLVVPSVALAQPPEKAGELGAEHEAISETATAAAKPIDPHRLEAFIDGMVTAYQREHLLPGVVVGLVYDGKPAFSKGYGYADLSAQKPVDPEQTLFRIGSVSKTFVWTSIMILVDRGQLDLDTDVRAYLTDVDLLFDGETPVTLNQIMAHRAGFEDSFGVFIHTDDEEISLAEALKADRPERVLTPEMRTSYSNWGSALAALIVQRVSGVEFATFVEQELTGPLEMNSTTLLGPSRMPEALRDRLAVGYGPKEGYPAPQAFMQLGPYAPAGGIATTATDMARWTRFHLGRGSLDGRRILSETAHETLWTRPFPDRPLAPDLTRGFFDGEASGIRTLGHGGGTACFLTHWAVVPEYGLGLFVSQNSTHDPSLIRELLPSVIGYLEGAAPIRTPAGKALTDDAASLEALLPYVGTYLPNRRSFTRFETLFSFTGISAVQVAKTGEALTLLAGAKPARFFPLEEHPDRFEDVLGRRIVFSRGEDGEVASFSGPSGVHTFEKAGLLDDPQLLLGALGLTATTSLLLWLLAFRRIGRPSGHTWRGAVVRWVALACSLPVLGLLIGVGVLVAVSAQTPFTDLLADYPPPALIGIRATNQAIFGGGILGLLSLFGAWDRSGFGIVFRLIHTLWALSLAALALLLFHWNLVFGSFA